jgi:DNA (cytosine-5)-methyltransferase 1
VNEKTIRYFSMFTGVGGFELGLVGSYGKSWQCIGFSEIDKYTNQLLAKKFPNVKNYGDATKIEADKLPDFDMLCGGFPCQSFSIAGKRRGFEDTRGTMFFHIARILEVKKPRLVFLENVKGLLNHNKGQTFKVIIQTLSELGYDVQWMVLNSKFFGVPQNRERVFIIGSLRGTTRPEILPFRQISSEVNELCGQQTNSIKARYTAIGDGSYVTKSKFNAQACAYRTRTYCNQPGRIEMRKDNIANQLTSVMKDSITFDGMKIRRLTPIECERLQGFPDGWTNGFSDTQRYKMMGNAVTVNVIRAIGEKL